MPLATFNNRHHLLCRRVFVDSDTYLPNQSPSPYNVLVDLENGIEQVIGVDIVSWNIPFDVVPMFFADNTHGKQRNNLLDIYVEDKPFTDSMSFTVALVATGYGSLKALGDGILGQIITAQTEAAGLLGTFHPLSYKFRYTIDASKRLLFEMRNASGDADSANVIFKFATGPSAGSSPWEALGFANASDTIVSNSPLINGPLPSVTPKMKPYRCVDISISQIKEYPVLRRIYLTGDEYNTTSYVKRGSLLLTEPLKRIDQMRVFVKLANGRTPALNAATGFDLIVDILSVAQVPDIPGWVKQIIRI